MEQEANQPFDLEKGPLARFLLIEIEPEDHVLVLTMHHIIGDQWSFGVIGSEFAFFYNAFCQGETPSAKPVPLQYADYAVWERRCLTDDWLSTQSDYWQKRLAGLSRLSLPTDYSAPVVQTFKGSHCMLELPASLIERLKQFSAEQNATVFMTSIGLFPDPLESIFRPERYRRGFSYRQSDSIRGRIDHWFVCQYLGVTYRSLRQSDVRRDAGAGPRNGVRGLCQSGFPVR